MTLEKYLNKIAFGDCVEIMKEIPEGSVDITFADPPFNLNKKYGGYKDKKSLEDYLKWCEKWLFEMVRITKPSGSIFVHNIPKWLTYYSAYLNSIAEFRHWISWDAMSAPLGKSLLPNHYGILYYVKDRKQSKFYDIRSPHPRCRTCNYLIKDYGGKKAGLHPFGPLLSDVWTDIHRIRHNKRRDEHPCQLPVHLLERLILMTTDENDIVFDPFVGTGTSAIAAKRLGRRFIGIDIDPKYVDISTQKLEKENSLTKIGDYWVSIYLDEIATISDKDWSAMQKYFEIPKNIKEIEKRPIQRIQPLLIKIKELQGKKLSYSTIKATDG
ncbi:MAG: site-specific DNA-methyltransferase [Myxococcota bacterium]